MINFKLSFGPSDNDGISVVRFELEHGSFMGSTEFMSTAEEIAHLADRCSKLSFVDPVEWICGWNDKQDDDVIMRLLISQPQFEGSLYADIVIADSHNGATRLATYFQVYPSLLDAFVDGLDGIRANGSGVAVLSAPAADEVTIDSAVASPQMSDSRA